MRTLKRDGPIRKEFLPFHKPLIEEEEIIEVIDTLKSGWLTRGPKTAKFEEEFTKYIGCKHAIAVNSCTAGLHLALVALGIGPGDEVITTPLTFAATANVIIHTGATPVFADINPHTLNINPDEIRKKITSKTKAIIPVHFAGQPCEMDKIMAIAEECNLFVIEDAAHAIGAEYKGKKVGNIGHVTSFSFYATKNITTGEGGMVTTNNDELAEKIRILSLHGISRDAWKRYTREGSWYYEVLYPGFKYNMTDIQAALGLVQLKKIDRMQEKRKQITSRYNEAFNGMPGITMVKEIEGIINARHLYQIIIDENVTGINRDRLIEELNSRGIGTSVHFIPLHLQPYYRKFGYKRGEYPVAEKVFKGIISLPLYPLMTEKDIEMVIREVKNALAMF